MHRTDGKGAFLGAKRTIRQNRDLSIENQSSPKLNERVVIGGELAPLHKITGKNNNLIFSGYWIS